MIKVYIASAYRLGDVAINVKNQLDISNKLIDEGFAPFVPLYSHFHNIIHPRSYKDWIELDFEWIKSCDCLLRILGESVGADDEVDHANKLGIPVFFATLDSIDIAIEEIKKFYE